MRLTGPEPRDETLVRRAAAGDELAYHELINRHAAGLHRTAFGILQDAALAEDAVQETFLAAFRGLSNFAHRSSFKTWLFSILIRQARLLARRRKKEFRLEWAEHSESPAKAYPDAKHDLDEAMRRLSDEHREILILREFDNLSYDEIADAIDVPRGTVESRLFRARQELRRMLKGY